MATTQTHKSNSGKSRRTTPGTVSIKRFDGRTVKQPAGLAFLMQQHRDVEKLFEKFEDSESETEKLALAEKICLMLAVHAKIEEELIYPDAREQIEDEDLIDEATIEHATAKDLIAQIESMEPGDQYFDAKVTVLGEYIKHHVKEEENELFPELKKTDMDLAALGATLKARAAEVERQLSAGGDAHAARGKVAAEARAGAHI